MPLSAALRNCTALDKTGTSKAALSVELTLALPDAAHLLSLSVPPGSRVADALLIAAQHNPIWASLAAEQNWGLAIWNQVVTPDRLLQNGDRIELLRPLIAEPKQERRERVDDQRAAAHRSRWRPDARGPARMSRSNRSEPSL